MLSYFQQTCKNSTLPLQWSSLVHGPRRCYNRMESDRLQSSQTRRTWKLEPSLLTFAVLDIVLLPDDKSSSWNPRLNFYLLKPWLCKEGFTFWSMIEHISRRISRFKSSVSYSASRSRASLRAPGLGKKKPWQGVGSVKIIMVFIKIIMLIKNR